MTPFLYGICVWTYLSAVIWRVCSPGRHIDTMIVVKHLKDMVRNLQADKSRQQPPPLLDSLVDIPPLLDSIDPSGRSGTRTPLYASGSGTRTPLYSSNNADMWNSRQRSSTVASWTAGMDSLCAARWCVCMRALP